MSASGLQVIFSMYRNISLLKIYTALQDICELWHIL